MEEKIFTIKDDEKNQRLDIFLAKKIAISRNNIQNMLKKELIFVNDKKEKANYKLKLGDSIKVILESPKEISIEKENIPLDILYEDDDIIVINKRRGMMVHPASGIYSGTLVNALLYHCKNLSGINGEIRPGIVHRLDKDTSGVMVVAKNDFAHNELANQMKERSTKKEYIALVHGNIMENKGQIETNIGRDLKDRKKMAVLNSGGKEAKTTFEVMERFQNATLVKCQLHTGRTHQIRVHMAFIKHPILGDPKYCNSKNKFPIEGQALHSEHLVIEHPRSKKMMEFWAKLPEDMEEIIKYFRLKSR